MSEEIPAKHVRCGGCHGIFPHSWTKDGRTGAGSANGGHYCSQKCHGVILFRLNLLQKVRRPEFA